MATRMFFNMKRTWFCLKRLPGWIQKTSLKHLRSSPETRVSVTFLGTSELHPGVRMGSLLTGFGNGSQNLFTDYKNFPNYTELHILLLFLLENEKGIYFGGLL